MKPIGGYLELELRQEENTHHRKAQLAIKSGRACLQIILQKQLPQKVWLPYYTCDALIEPLTLNNIKYDFYNLNKKLEIADQYLDVSKNESLIYINYFGLKSIYLEKLEQIYRDRLWLDQTQAFFYQPKPSLSWHFNSARKFFGVPDGAYLYAPAQVNLPSPDTWTKNKNYRFEHLLLRHQGKLQEGYTIFQENEHLNGGEIARMSELTEVILSQVDYDSVARKRRENYLYLHQVLAAHNQLSSEVTNLPDNSVPFCYPYLPKKPINKQYFWKQNMFIPIFWRECLERISSGFEWEKQLSSTLLPLPIDHRYDTNDMDIIINAIFSYEK